MGVRLCRGLTVALAMSVPATLASACSLGFDTFNPVVASAGDAGHPDTGQGGSDSQPGGDTGTSGGDTGTADSGSSGDTGATMEAGCVGLQSCLDTGGACGMSCGQKYQQCVGMCGGGSSCRQMCRNQQNQCRSTCASDCVSCTTSAGCTDNAECQTASMM